MNKTLDNKFFGGMREDVILRDNSRCVKCNITRQEHTNKYGRDITVDHIDGNGRNAANKNNDIGNLQTLCLGCHGRKDARKLTPEQALNIFHSRDNKKDAKALCIAYNVHIRGVSDISLGKSWSSITGVRKEQSPTKKSKAL